MNRARLLRRRHLAHDSQLPGRVEHTDARLALLRVRTLFAYADTE